MRKSFLAAVVLGLALALSAMPALAGTIDFNIAPATSGSIAYTVAGGALVGTNITVDTVAGLNTPLNDGVVRGLFGGGLLNNALFNFTTGNLTGTQEVGALDFWFFGGGGTVSLVGGVDLNNNGILGDAGDIPDGTLLMTGSFRDASVQGNSTQFKVAVASFLDVKDTRLLDFFGLPAVVYQGSFNISFDAAGHLGVAGGTFTSTNLLSGDIVNFVPEPASLLLLGSGLLGLAGLRRKK